MTHELRNIITANLYLLCAFVAVISAIWLVCIVRAGSKPTPEPKPKPKSEPAKPKCKHLHWAQTPFGAQCKDCGMVADV